MALADDTLALGHQLVLNSWSSRPRQIALRKAVHCAYYAAFGSLCEEWARNFDRGAQPAAVRMLQHGTVSDACKQVGNSGKLRAGAVCPADLKQVAQLVPWLQKCRQKADYDPAARFTKNETLILLNDADQAIQRLRQARSTYRSELHLFLLLCAGARR